LNSVSEYLSTTLQVNTVPKYRTRR
jgi:hypothetical protein